MIQHLTKIALTKFEDAGVVESRSVFFGGQQVGAEVAVLLLFGGLGSRVVGGEGGDGGCLGASRGGIASVFHLSQGVQMLSLYSCDAGEQLLELGVVSALRVLRVFVNAKLLLTLEVLDEGLFLLCEYHNFLRVWISLAGEESMDRGRGGYAGKIQDIEKQDTR